MAQFFSAVFLKTGSLLEYRFHRGYGVGIHDEENGIKHLTTFERVLKTIGPGKAVTPSIMKKLVQRGIIQQTWLDKNKKLLISYVALQLGLGWKIEWDSPFQEAVHRASGSPVWEVHFKAITKTRRQHAKKSQIKGLKRYLKRTDSSVPQSLLNQAYKLIKLVNSLYVKSRDEVKRVIRKTSEQIQSEIEQINQRIAQKRVELQEKFKEPPEISIGDWNYWMIKGDLIS